MTSVPPPVSMEPQPQPQETGLSTGAIVAIVLGVLAVVLIPIMCLLLAFLLPALGRAREVANRAVCGANLRGICQSMLTYAVVNNDQFPPSFGPLVLDGSISPKSVICPRSPDATTVPANMSIQQLAQWADEHSTYIYVYPNKGANADGETIILYEPLSNHNNEGINIAYGDGHISFARRSEAESELRKQGLDPYAQSPAQRSAGR